MQVFAECPKLHQEKMSIGAGELESWGQSIAHSRFPTGMRRSTKSLTELLRACPACSKLYLVLSPRVANSVSDEFLVQLAQQCPRLVLLKAEEGPQGAENLMMMSLMGFAGMSLHELGGTNL